MKRPRTRAEKLRFLIECATRAPSSHNTQPWAFGIDGTDILVYADFTRNLPIGDPINRELFVSVGAAIRNIEEGAVILGFTATVHYFPVPAQTDLVARVELHGTANQFNQNKLTNLEDRRTNHSPYVPTKKIADEILKKLTLMVAEKGVTLHIFRDRTKISRLGELTKQGMLEYLKKPEFRDELSSWVRHDWSDKNDGLYGYTIGMPGAASIMAPVLIKSTELIAHVAGGEKKAVESSPYVCVITTKEETPTEWVKTGQAYESIALYAQSAGIATGILTAASEAPEQRKILKKMAEGEPSLFFRLGYATGRDQATRRRGVDRVLRTQSGTTDTGDNPYRDMNTHSVMSEKELVEWYLRYTITDMKAKSSLHTASALKTAWSRFAIAREQIPAYAKFLEANGWHGSDTIADTDVWHGSDTIADTDVWESLPLMDKKNYVSKYPLKELTPRGEHLSSGRIVSLSSGSSGKPFLWPRGIWQEIEGALFHERLLTELFEIAKHKTLLVVAFSMGGYLAGTYTYNSVRWVSFKGYPLTVITPGIDMNDGLEMIKKLGGDYDQIILAGYPPFIKDMLEQGKRLKIDWKQWNMKILFASEFFSEKWRAHVAKTAGIADPVTGTTNIYGASEGTLFGWETPESILIRQEALKNSKLHRALFGSDSLPTLVEYDPLFRYFEEQDGKLILTAWAGVPLIRYDLKDHGGILTAEKRRNILTEFGVKLDPRIMSDLPMVYLLHRADGAASIYGVLLYPEYIKDALESSPVWDKLSGRFTVITTDKSGFDTSLNIHVELKTGEKVTAQETSALQNLIKQNLFKHSREYTKLEDSLGEKVWPQVSIVKNHGSIYFSKGIKQPWISR